MNIDVAKEAECGSIHVVIEYKSEYKPSLILALWKQVSDHANRILASLESAEEIKN